VELKTNHIPKGLVRLERLFDSNDVSKKIFNLESGKGCA
jgi:hypothetical protein